MRDRLGLGVFCLGFSESLQEGLDSIGIPIRNEVGVEAFYNLAITPWLYLTGDIQLIRPPQTGTDTAIIAGVRAQVVF